MFRGSELYLYAKFLPTYSAFVVSWNEFSFFLRSRNFSRLLFTMTIYYMPKIALFGPYECSFLPARLVLHETKFETMCNIQLFAPLIQDSGKICDTLIVEKLNDGTRDEDQKGNLKINEKCRMLQKRTVNGSFWYGLEYIIACARIKKGAENNEIYVKNRKSNSSPNQH
ncbi:hypothetical protein BDC45DRAFT_535450 [Circinella umbellata]|nr:hypothetical protein BDC45DRAFT_535450 [Circinella umbellata]